MPNIPRAVIDKAEELHKAISKKSSAQAFACVQYAVDAANQRLEAELGLETVEAHEQVRSILCL